MKDYRNLLFPYAYNILGSWEDAKDIVQDVLSSYLTTPHEGIQNEKGYLIRCVINTSINVKNKKKKLVRESNSLPEPIATERADTNINLSDIVSYSLLILLEQLNPKERAVFILKEGFNYSHEEIADLLSSTVENSRKLLSRAKSKINPTLLTQQKVHKESVPDGILDKYVEAIRSRDMKMLENLLAEDIVFVADGGKNLNVFKKICTGNTAVSDLLLYTYEKYHIHFSSQYTEINHQPAILYYIGDQLKVCQVLSISPDNGKIFRISIIIDPEKLKNIWIREKD
ncbi:sigma-70 family RNA polymerase sigma factor [Xanthocytophaga agilis]|uniref:Sigma-70 family RNA polymerase sigma factor n=1 Tax=Xanthocytophaga agilis TaxID=3048010 RepID=A0AAE3UCM8_9BACT|nr:sigma-70 family RNA polymerase sigma factor [Xanthocytophaga agilis]MDJ1499516.1 sigma-70 family RNA polymerase sigma factor [Xanthocytophaga agilis]